MTREMKDSGVEWIGKIPKNWYLARFKNFAQSGMGITLLKEDVLDNQAENFIPIYSATQEDKYFGYTNNKSLVLKPGDLVIPARGNSIGNVKIVFENSTSTQTTIYSKIFSKKIYPKFLKYCADGLKDWWFEFDQTAIPQITVSQVNNNLVPIPSLDTQRMIISHLDSILKNLNLIIFDTQKSVNELKNYKINLITETVNSGLNVNVERKKSEIDWIGNIPKHWKLSKVKRLFLINKVIANKSGYKILSVTQKGLKVKDITQNQGQMAANYEKYQIVEKNDFVMNHMDLLTGWVDLSDQEGVTSPDYRVFRSRDKNIVLNDYYLYIFQICYMNKIFYSLGQGVSNLGRWRLQTDKFLDFYLPVPPKEEQIEIVDFLNSKVVEIDTIIDEKNNLLNELEQYKKSLIYEYVTGKKEV